MCLVPSVALVLGSCLARTPRCEGSLVRGRPRGLNHVVRLAAERHNREFWHDHTDGSKNLSSERQRSFPMVPGEAAMCALLLLGSGLFCSSEQLTNVYSGLFRNTGSN
jgi:hypothetical protein